jgi:DNA-binding beta-propeller fold protein YncE
VDGSTLFIADAAADSTSGSTNGAIFSLPVGGGALSTLDDTIDRPGDVLADPSGAALWVSGFTADGEAAIFSMGTSASTPTAELTGSGLSDPTQLAVLSDGSALFVLDSLGTGGGKAAIWELDTATWAAAELEADFDVSFPGGLAVDEGDTRLFFTTIGDAGLHAIHLDGSGTESYESLAALDLPAGVTSAGSQAFVADSSSLVGSDIYLLSF